MFSRFFAAAFAAAVLSCGTAEAQAVTAQQCLAAQLRLSGNACKGLARCYAKAMKAGAAVSTTCIEQKAIRLESFGAEVEATANCLVEGQLAAVGDQLQVAAEDMATALTLGGGKCAAIKVAAIGKACTGFFRCNAAADAASSPLDPDCLVVPARKLTESFATAENRGGCATTGDAATLLSSVAAVVDSVRTALRGTGTTTTTVTATTGVTSSTLQ